MPDPLRERVRAALGAAYDIDAEIGRGGMGVVYRCLDRKLRRLVAIKVLPPELAYRDEVRTRFLREAETAAQLSHPNIVPIYSVDDRDGLVWFVMALVEGPSLAAMLAREQRPGLEVVQRTLVEVADALAYAHSRGIIHRDIKPDNILLDRHSGRAMVTDFGIARAMEGDARLTVPGIAVGTPAYMSPEQAMGERAIDGRSDIYALAVVGYQMLAGELPFQAANTPSMLMKHISDPLRPLHEVRPGLPSALAHVIERALAKAPADRWGDAAAFRDALAACSLEPGGQAPVEPTPPRAAEPERHVSAAWKRPAVPAPAPAAPPAPSAPVAAIPELPPVRLPRISRRYAGESGEAERGGHRDRDAYRARDGYRDHPPSGRDAVAAANLRGRGDALDDLPPVPAFMPDSWRQARMEWRRDQAGGRGPRHGDGPYGGLSREEAIRRFRAKTGRVAVSVGALAAVNLAFSPGFLWFLFPAAAWTMGLLHRGSSLWANGVRMKDVFGREAADRIARGTPAESSGPRAPSPQALAEQLAPRDVLAGPYGDIVRRAAMDKSAAHDALAKLSPVDRQLIPDVAPTVDALADRVGSIGHALHRLHESVTPGALGSLERTIAETAALPESPERARKLELLERQRATLSDLAKRRETLEGQLESAALMLQNMHLDLVALRSAGVQSVLNDVTSATQEARALSRDIQIALEAAKDVR